MAASSHGIAEDLNPSSNVIRVQSLKSRLKGGFVMMDININTHDAGLDMERKYLILRTRTRCQTKTELLFKTWSIQDDPSKALLPSRLQKSQGRDALKTLAMEVKRTTE